MGVVLKKKSILCLYVGGVSKVGLDHAIYRQYIQPKPTNRDEAILVELEDKEEEEMEEVFDWRKDYTLHDYFCENFKVENCDYIKLTREDLEKFLVWLKAQHGKEDKFWEGETHDYSKEISQLNDILKYDYFNEYQYFYWAWW